MFRMHLFLFACLMISQGVLAQRPCLSGRNIEGSITDPTGAAIPQASIALAGQATVTTDGKGRFNLSCVTIEAFVLDISAPGFSTKRVQVAKGANPVTQVNARLDIAAVQQDVQVTAADASSGTGASTRELNTDQIRQLSDDPNDVIQQN